MSIFASDKSFTYSLIHTMTKLNLITFASSLASRQSVFTDHHELLHAIEQHYDVQYVFADQLDQTRISDDATMVLVGSGGVEEMVKAHIDELPANVLLIADGLKNSLAASLEILSWMRLSSHAGRVLHGPTSAIVGQIDAHVAAHEAIRKLRNQRVGVIGKPSGWLIASNVSVTGVKQGWGVQMLDLPLDEVVAGYQAIDDNDPLVQQLTDEFIAGATAVREPSRPEVVKAMRLYRSVKAMCEHYHLDSLTLNCFDLIPRTGTTGCVALALLNGEGIPAGCEGDEQTLLTMLAVKAVTGEPSFMANPSQIVSGENHEMIFAHCTIAPSMTHHYIVRNHYESLSGVAVEGYLQPGTEMTVVKCGGRNMERCFVSRAQLLQCTSHPIMCRTQLHLRLEASLDYFLERSIGNHHVIVKGDWSQQLQDVLAMLGAEQ